MTFEKFRPGVNHAWFDRVSKRTAIGRKRAAITGNLRPQVDDQPAFRDKLEMQKFKLLAKIVLLTGASFLVACGTKDISPAMAGKPGVTYGNDPGGYPSIATIAFTRATPMVGNSVESCIIRGVEQPVNTPTVNAGIWQVTATGAMRWEGGGVSSLPFRYNLTLEDINGTAYTFSRISYERRGVFR